MSDTRPQFTLEQDGAFTRVNMEYTNDTLDAMARRAAENIEDELVQQILSRLGYVKVVRCRECKHARIIRPLDWRTGKPSTVIEEWYCQWHSNAEGASEIDPDGFCAWGERKEDE